MAEILAGRSRALASFACVVLAGCTPTVLSTNLATGGPIPANSTSGLIATRVPTPFYPLRARSLFLEGWVQVEFDVNRNGNVVPNTVVVVAQDPPGYFEQAAVSAARGLQFQNLIEERVEEVSYVFRFELENGPVSADPPSRPRSEESTEATIANRRVLPLNFIRPEYPVDALEMELQGHATVSFTVAADGTVENLQVTGAEPEGVFNEAALRAASRLRFSPRLENGEAVATENVQHRFEWRLP